MFGVEKHTGQIGLLVHLGKRREPTRCNPFEIGLFNKICSDENDTAVSQ